MQATPNLTLGGLKKADTHTHTHAKKIKEPVVFGLYVVLAVAKLQRSPWQCERHQTMHVFCASFSHQFKSFSFEHP